MSVLRDYELWSLTKLNVELMSRIFEMNFTPTIDMFTGRLALALVLDACFFPTGQLSNVRIF